MAFWLGSDGLTAFQMSMCVTVQITALQNFNIYFTRFLNLQNKRLKTVPFGA